VEIGLAHADACGQGVKKSDFLDVIMDGSLWKSTWNTHHSVETASTMTLQTLSWNSTVIWL